ncbi:Hypothetical predicted protein [Marmota monax]|uniref:Uncharacterized protein n=1 Tax=Marmota monax TaxID=9995 RepID=A0A5E4B591_MARMO|nr:Hypothetical predicted protein [Marmota monax]
MGAGEPVGLHHGPSLRRRRGGGEKKNKNPAMELSPPPLGLSEAAAAPPARCAHFSSNSQRGCCACLCCLRVPRCAVPGGVWSRPPAPEALTSGAGEMPNRFPSLAAAPKCKKDPSSPGRTGSRDKMVPFRTQAAVTRWQGQDSGLPGRDEGVGPAGGRLRQEGAREAGGELGRALRPAPAHSPSHPHARTRSSCCCCCCSCCRRLEAAGALKARLLPTASAAPGLFPSSSGALGRGCGCSLLQWGARSRGPAPGQQAASFEVHAKSTDALFQPSPSSAWKPRAASTLTLSL